MKTNKEKSLANIEFQVIYRENKCGTKHRKNLWKKFMENGKQMQQMQQRKPRP